MKHSTGRPDLLWPTVCLSERSHVMEGEMVPPRLSHCVNCGPPPGHLQSVVSFFLLVDLCNLD